MYNVTADKTLPSGHWLCFWFLENMTPVNRAIRPTPEMVAAVTASLPCKRQESESDSVSVSWVQTVHSTRMSISGSFMCLIASLTNSGVNKYWQGNAERRAAWGRNLWMGQLANDIHRPEEGNSLQPAGFKADRSPEGDCGKDSEMKPDGWNPGWWTVSSWDTYKVEEELLLNLNELWPGS